MKNIRFIVYIIIIGVLSPSCSKKDGISAPASIVVVNAMPTSQPIIPVFRTKDPIQYFAWAAAIGYGSSLLYSPTSGSNTLYVVQNTDTIPSDPKVLMFNGTLNLNAGTIYSFFLAGDTTKPDTLFTRDNIPAYKDSSAGVRFVNLSPGSHAISISLDGNPPSQTEFGPLNYKEISTFKKYTATSSMPGYYTFDIIDQASGTILTTYTWNYAQRKNNTIVIAGSEDPSSSTPLNLFQVNHY